MPAVFTGKCQQILGNTGKYWLVELTTLEFIQQPTLGIRRGIFNYTSQLINIYTEV